MRRIASLIIGALLIIAAPLVAQAPIPTSAPAPTQTSAELQALDQIAQRLQAMSATDASTANGSTIFLAASFFILMVIVLIAVAWIARGGLNRFWEAITTERKGRLDAEKKEEEARDEHERYVSERDRDRSAYDEKITRNLDQFASTQMRMLEMFESKGDAKAGRDEIVRVVNQHVTNDGDKTRKELKAVVEKVIEAKETAEKAATVDDLNRVLKPVLDKFDELTEEVRAAIRKVDTGPLSASKVPDTDPSAEGALPADASSSKLPGVPL